MGFEVCEEAKPGSAAYSWASDHMLGTRLRLYMPSLLVVSAGTNDAGGMVSGKIEVFSKRANRIVDLAHEYGVEVLWVIPPTNYVKTQRLDRWLAANSTADYLFDSRCVDIKIADKVHPTIKAAKGWAKLVWQTILKGYDPCYPGEVKVIVDQHGVGIEWPW
jgi:lysophospholipase L1-like esterase